MALQDTSDKISTHEGGKERVSDLLLRLVAEAPDDRLTVRDLIVALEDRAFGFLLLILSLFTIPPLYGVAQVIALPLIFIIVQIIIGRHKLWLPRALGDRSISVTHLRKLTNLTVPFIRWFENISRPRAVWLTRGKVERIWGVVLLAFAISIAVPLPLTNSVPGCGVALVALGFIERDGLLTVFGALIGTVWVAILVLFGATAIHEVVGLINTAF